MLDVILFSSSKCPLCVSAHELLEKIEDINYLKIEADSSQEAMRMAMHWEVYKVPRMFGIQDANVVFDIEGLPEGDKFNELVQRYLQRDVVQAEPGSS